MKPETIMIDNVKYVREDSQKEITNNIDGLKAVLIRSYASGVHYGYLKKTKDLLAGLSVVLVNSRRIWNWYGAASLSQLAMEGVKDKENSKITMILPEIQIQQVIEIIPLSKEALGQALRKILLTSCRRWNKYFDR